MSISYNKNALFTRKKSIFPTDFSGLKREGKNLSDFAVKTLKIFKKSLKNTHIFKHGDFFGCIKLQS